MIEMQLLTFLLEGKDKFIEAVLKAFNGMLRGSKRRRPL